MEYLLFSLVISAVDNCKT